MREFGSCKARSVCLLVLCALTVQHGSVGAAPPVETESNSVSLGPSGALEFFSDYALLVDRGIAQSPFGGTADELIVEHVKHSARFRNFLGVTAQQLPEFEAAGYGQGVQSSETSGQGTPDDQEPLENCSRFQTVLDEEQRAKLPLIYLNLEGLMAIRRPEFRDLIGISPEKQKHIRELAADGINGARVIHLRIFTMRNDEIPQLPKFIVQLRQLSAELDRKILDVLTDSERARLAKLVVRAADIGDLVDWSGVGCSPNLLKRVSKKRH